MKNPIEIKTTISAPIEKVWEAWSQPEHIKKWNAASEDWHTTRAENDLRKGGRFSSRMEAKDGSFGFDFGGTYDEVTEHQSIKYTMDDDRKVSIQMSSFGDQIVLTEVFEPEGENPIEMQRGGWQSILDNFKKYVERL